MNTLIIKIVTNNAITFGIHVLLCLVTWLIIIAPFPLTHIGSVIFSITYTIAFLLLYYLCGRFILHSTGDVWTDLASVTALAIIITSGMLLGKLSEVFLIVTMPYYPVAITLEYSVGIPQIIDKLFTVAIPLLPSLFAWIGMIMKWQ